MLEIRIFSFQEHKVFTVIEGKRIYSEWIGGIVVENPLVKSLRIDRSIHILLNGKRTPAVLTETIRRVESERESATDSAEFQFRLQREGREFVSTYHPTLTDGIWEIQESAKPEFEIWLQTCFHCRYAHLGGFLGNDREFRCYRDVPDAYNEIRLRGKQASQNAQYARTYSVSAFHACAGW